MFRINTYISTKITESRRRKLRRKMPLVLTALESGLAYEDIKSIYKIEEDSIEAFLEACDAIRFASLSTTQCMSVTLEIDALKQEIFSLIQKNLIYPIFLIMMSWLLLLFFSFKFSPQLYAILEDFDTSLNLLRALIISARFLSIVTSFIFIIGIVLSLILTNVSLRFVVYSHIQHLKPLVLMKEVITYRFSVCLAFLLSLNISTLEVVKQLRSLKELVDVSWIAYHLDQKFNQGKSIFEVFDDSYLSESFITFYKQGIITSNAEAALQHYKRYGMEVIEYKFKRLSIFLKTIAYLVLISLMILFYSCLFMPLNILEGVL